MYLRKYKLEIENMSGKTIIIDSWEQFILIIIDAFTKGPQYDKFVAVVLLVMLALWISIMIILFCHCSLDAQHECCHVLDILFGNPKLAELRRINRNLEKLGVAPR